MHGRGTEGAHLGCSVNALAIICKQLYSEGGLILYFKKGTDRWDTGFIDAPFGKPFDLSTNFLHATDWIQVRGRKRVHFTDGFNRPR